MRNFNKEDLIIFSICILFAIPAGILITLSGVKDTDSDNSSKFSGTYFWIGVSLSIIAGIFAFWFFIRTRIDLFEPTITDTNITGV